MTAIRITEVGPRDGLQSESACLSTAVKVQFIDLLSAAGIPEIEVSSFVSSKWVPQLADAAEVFAAIQRRIGTSYSALVPNEQGFDRACAARADKIAVFISATEEFSQRNANGSIAEVLARIAPVVKRARAAGIPVRGYVSCVIRCPFAGEVSPAQVRGVCAALLELGVDELDLGDTIGAATSDSIARLYEGLFPLVAPSATTLHLHDTHGRAIACALRALELGVRSFDSSAGGLGGCPYAPGAPGNVATESLVAAAKSAGFVSGVDTQRVAEAGLWIRQQLSLARGASL
ncbi:MAG: hydroxymethylglutaryl-CoA lyase [Phycisphaerales bacterium]|nr:hydroxymethylglutaryl-CoA lyase [Phycisphaerales bacterium]